MKKGKISMIITISLVCFLLVMIIFMQFKVVQESQESNIDSMQEAELRQELTNWKTKYEETKAKHEETSNTLQTYKEESTSDEKTKETLESELENLNLILGKTDVEGEGVVISLRQKTEDELGDEEEITAISSIDLVYIVNYLKDAGAEAISINDERIVNSTDMADVGGSIKINSKYLRTDTYEIKAIGNSSYLESSLFGKGGFVEQLNTSGIKADIERNKKVTIPKYTGDFETKYMQEKESEDEK